LPGFPEPVNALLSIVTLLSRRLEYQGRLVLLERFVGVFRQCKQSLGNKGLQLVSMIGGNLIDELNTIHKKVVFEDLYILNKILFACSARCRVCRALLALLAIEHVELCSPTSASNKRLSVKPSSMQVIVSCATDCFVDYILAVTS